MSSRAYPSSNQRSFGCSKLLPNINTDSHSDIHISHFEWKGSTGPSPRFAEQENGLSRIDIDRVRLARESNTTTSHLSLLNEHVETPEPHRARTQSDLHLRMTAKSPAPPKYAQPPLKGVSPGALSGRALNTSMWASDDSKVTKDMPKPSLPYRMPHHPSRTSAAPRNITVPAYPNCRNVTIPPSDPPVMYRRDLPFPPPVSSDHPEQPLGRWDFGSYVGVTRVRNASSPLTHSGADKRTQWAAGGVVGQRLRAPSQHKVYERIYSTPTPLVLTAMANGRLQTRIVSSPTGPHQPVKDASETFPADLMDVDIEEPQREPGAPSSGCTPDAEPTLLSSGATYEELNRLISAFALEHPSSDLALQTARKLLGKSASNDDRKDHRDDPAFE